MGNFFRRNNDPLVEVQEEINLENNNQVINYPQIPELKTIIKVKNPFYLLKETIHLEKDAIKNIYYIKFKYDSLINFNCFINFNVKENTQRKNLKQKDDYELCFIPTDKFVEKNIVINNLPKGKNQDFFEKNAFLDYEYFEQNTTRIKEESYEYEEEEEEDDDELDGENNNNINNSNNNNEIKSSEDKTNNTDQQNEENETLINYKDKEIINNYEEEAKDDNINNNNEINYEEYEEIFDIGIEFVPYYDKNSLEFEQNKENNEIVLITLINIEKKENNDLEIKKVLQKLKKHNHFFELKDIYDGSGNNGKCVVCFTNNRNTVFLPCRHSCCCKKCSGTLIEKVCPLCKEDIKDIIVLYQDSVINNSNEQNNDDNFFNSNEDNNNKSDNNINDNDNNDNAPVLSINEA